jgi:hypothetical protein
MLPPSWKTEIEETVEKATKLEGERQKTANDENAADIGRRDPSLLQHL